MSDVLDDNVDPADEPRRPRRRRRDDSAELTALPPDRQGPRAFAAVAALAVVVVLIGTFAVPDATPSTPVAAVEPVDSSTAVCPEPGAIDLSRTISTMMVLPDLAGQDRAGEAAVSFLQGSDDPDLADDAGLDIPEVDLAAPGDAAAVVAESRRLPPLEIRATGALAPGLVAAQTTQDSFNAGRGLASVACLGPATSWWFVGGGSTAGRTSDLVLVNPETTAAELEVAISGPDGPVSTPRLRGIVVEPRSRVVVRLAREAPRLTAAAWHVQVRAGRIVAALSDKQTDGFTPQGADWIPASAEPSTRVLIPGVIPGTGGRQLLIHAPGDVDADVAVRLITAGGSFVPSALTRVEVPGGSVVFVDLDEAGQGEALTVDLRSDVPIVAGVRQRHVGVDATKDALEDISFTSGAVRIGSTAAVAGMPAERSTAVTVWITAPAEIRAVTTAADDAMTMPEVDAETPAPVTVTLRVLPVDDSGVPLPSPEDLTVTVPSDRLVEVDIPRPDGAAWYALLATAEGGEVVIAHEALRRNANGSLITGYPWRPLRVAVTVPVAIAEPDLAVPSAP